MKFKIYDDSKNYTAQIIRLPSKVTLKGLDNLVGVSVQGNLCLITKDYPEDDLYLFFPAGTVLSEELLRYNNLFRNENLNYDQTKKGYFDQNCRVKAVKFKGHVSSGIVLKLESLHAVGLTTNGLKEGDEFNELEGKFICRKYIVPFRGSATSSKKVKILDELIDSRLFPEHMDSHMLLKYMSYFDLDDHIVITTKLHGTSGRVGLTLVKRQLSLLEKFAKFLGVKVQEEEYKIVCGSHHVVKSIDFETLKGKQHFYAEDLWTKVGEEFFRGKLRQGEMVYFEIIGKDYTGVEIQKNYSYGLSRPDVYIYRISQINPQGIEVDLPWRQVKARANELFVKCVPEIFGGGTLRDYLKSQALPITDPVQSLGGEKTTWRSTLESYLKLTFLDKPSKMDPKVIEEGICIRKETYPRPHIYKLKSPLFYLHESGLADAGVADIEEQN